MPLSGSRLIKLNIECVSPDPEPPIVNSLYEWSGICGQFELCSFMYSFVILLHLISSFSFTRFSLVSYTYVSIESNDLRFLLSFELNVISLIFSLKTLCLSLLNLCCTFNIDLIWYWLNSLMLSMSIFFTR